MQEGAYPPNTSTSTARSRFQRSLGSDEERGDSSAEDEGDEAAGSERARGHAGSTEPRTFHGRHDSEVHLVDLIRLGLLSPGTGVLECW